MTRLLCVADLHLGAGGDYGREPGDRLRDQEKVWRQILALAAERDVDAIAFAGDAFHRRRPTPAELVAFQRPLQEAVAEHDFEILAINGNHDVENANLPSSLELFTRELDLHVQPNYWNGPDGIVIGSLPWTPVSRLVAARDGGDRDDVNRLAATALITTAQQLRDSDVSVLMLHWSISGASTPAGMLTDDFREVVLPLGSLEAIGFDAIVAGHIHRAQNLVADADVVEIRSGGHPDGNVIGHGTCAPIFYTGSPLPVDFGEATVPHGVWILDIDPATAACEFVEIPSRPFVTIDADLIDDTTGGDITDLVTGVIPFDLADAVVRMRVRATEDQARRVDWPVIRRFLDNAGIHKLFATKVDVIRSARARVEGLDEELGPMQALDLWIEAEGLNTQTGSSPAMPEEPDLAASLPAEQLRLLAGAYLETARV